MIGREHAHRSENTQTPDRYRSLREERSHHASNPDQQAFRGRRWSEALAEEGLWAGRAM